MFNVKKSKNNYPKSARTYHFKPRIINSVKIENAIILSADEHIRKAGKVLQENSPWIKVQIFSNPLTASNYHSDSASVILLDDTAMTFVDAEKIRKNNKDVLLVLLSHQDLIHRSPPSVAVKKFPYTAKADLIFAVNKKSFIPQKIINAIVRCAEDKLNIEEYSRERRFIFLIVDDEPRWFSEFLPPLYNIIGQRADVMIARTFEEAMRFIFNVEKPDDIPDNYREQGRGDDIVCLITDIFFPKNNALESDAGRDLVKLIDNLYPRIPIIIASKAKEADDLKDIAFIMPKGDPGSLKTLSDYIHDFTGMGDFVIRDHDGNEFYRIKDIRELLKIMEEAEQSTTKAKKLRQFLQNYGEKDYFSTWLYMHGFRELGDKLRPQRHTGQQLVRVLKQHLQQAIERMERTPLKINGEKVNNLTELLNLLKTADPGKLQYYSDNDIFSNWLDRKGYSELAEQFRPIHGSGSSLTKKLADIVEKWIAKEE